MKASYLSKLLDGYLLGEDLRVNFFTFDSRECREGALFIPLKGKRDGHLFISDAFKKGAFGTLSEKKLTPEPGKFVIVVKNPLEGFKKIGEFKRKSFGGTVIAITGSVGKTTTKELLLSYFSSFSTAYGNKKSYNNLIGVSYTLSNLPENVAFYVQELGTNRKGEIGELSGIVSPHVAIVTAIGKAHTSSFKRIEEVVKEKMEITSNVDLAIVPDKFATFSRAKETITFGENGKVKIKEVSYSLEGTKFTLEFKGKKTNFYSKVPGYSVVNSTAIAFAVSSVLNLPLEELIETVKNFSPPEMRMEVLNFKNLKIINDSYNANPISMENGIRVLSLSKEKKIAILGEMLELSDPEKEHEKLGKLLNRYGIDTLIAYGEATLFTVESFKGEGYHFKDKEELLNFVRNYDFSKTTVLVKGSRGNRLEEVVKIITERYKN